MEDKSFKLGGEDLVKNTQFKMVNGKKLWRVTSVINAMNPPTYTVPEDELLQYAARGTLVHLEASLLLGHGISLDEKREAEKTLNEGSLKLQAINPEVVKNFMAQFPEFKWEEAIVETFLWDEVMGLCGTCDLIISKGQDRHLVIADWKTASSYGKDKRDLYFKQMAAYSLMLPLPERDEIKGFYIFPLNPKNARGWGEPIFTNEVKKYQTDFLADLLKFQSLTK
jgi:hypothetical protein